MFQQQFIIGHNGKYDAVVLSRNCNTTPPTFTFDTMVASYLIDIREPRKLESLVKRYFHVDKEDLQQLYNRCTNATRKSLPDKWWEQISKVELETYAKADVYWTYKLYEVLSKKLVERKLDTWFYDVEMPFLNILTQSELCGVRIDTDKLVQLAVEYTQRSKDIQQELLLHAPNVNLNSPKQLQELLFIQLQLPTARRTKTGYSTDNRVLTGLADLHIIPRLLLEYREVEKMLSTYIRPLLAQQDDRQRIHTTYNQTLTKTRRLSSQNPNLQNIPAHAAVGKAIKSCFVASNDMQFIILDYDQIEMRLLAHFANDATLIQWFTKGIDIHQQTADTLGLKDRHAGKTLNFSLIYGKTVYGIAKDYHVTHQEAQTMLNRYFERFPAVQRWRHSIEYASIANGGYVVTLCGGELFVGDYASATSGQREHIQRCAVNYVIQGSSQDILKQAVVRIYHKTSLVPLLLVHDELVYEVPQSQAKELHTILAFEMEHVVQLKVPLKVTGSINQRWVK